MQKLFRSRSQKVFAGVCGGLSKYFNVDPVFIRIIFVVALFSGGLGLIAYIIFWIATPQEPLRYSPIYPVGDYSEVPPLQDIEEETSEMPKKTKVFFGYLLIAIGLIIMLGELVPHFDFSYVLALIFVGIGIFLLFSNKKSEEI